MQPASGCQRAGRQWSRCWWRWPSRPGSGSAGGRIDEPWHRCPQPVTHETVAEHNNGGTLDASSSISKISTLLPTSSNFPNQDKAGEQMHCRRLKPRGRRAQEQCRIHVEIEGRVNMVVLHTPPHGRLAFAVTGRQQGDHPTAVAHQDEDEDK
jgi:hypothetical protein